MTLKRIEELTFSGSHGPVRALLARPGRVVDRSAAVLVLHEGIGITKSLGAFAERLSCAGYLTLVPDLYSHDAARQALTEAEVLRHLALTRGPDREERLERVPEPERSVARKVVAWFDARDTSTYFSDVQAAVQFLKQRDDVRSDAIASIGFSLGGGLTSQLAASGADLAGGVIFYGQAPSEDRISAIRYPLLGHYAATDPAITPFVTGLKAEFARHGKKLDAYVYPGTEHGFFNAARPTFDSAAADRAYGRTLDFLAARLAPRDSERRETQHDPSSDAQFLTAPGQPRA